MIILRLAVYPRESGVDVGRLPGDGDDGEQAEVDARRHALDVDPERHPGHHHRQHARHVHVQHVVADVSLQDEPDLGARVRSCDKVQPAALLHSTPKIIWRHIGSLLHSTFRGWGLGWGQNFEILLLKLFILFIFIIYFIPSNSPTYANSPLKQSLYVTYVYTQKSPLPKITRSYGGGGCPVRLPWIRQ